MADGFLGRWSRRKDAVRKGREVEEPVVEAKAVPSHQPSPASGRGSDQALPAATPSPPGGEAGGEGCSPEPTTPPPTLDDARSLTLESDFARFAKPDVAPEVKNAAFKKLFSDPHFNIMDGLDTYIDDYSRPDPIPPEMLRSLTSAKFLKLFDEEEKKEQAEAEQAAAAREVADAPTPENVAQSSSRTEQALPPADDHADPDLRLQQDDAPGPAGPGAGSR